MAEKLSNAHIKLKKPRENFIIGFRVIYAETLFRIASKTLNVSFVGLLVAVIICGRSESERRSLATELVKFLAIAYLNNCDAYLAPTAC
ncbi:hypothetical protein THIOKS12350005 [Thiocapsa sp. KS1]|nr:hypothetical protein THIOKS12350005 [Thiocapsa sp. KS1]